MTLRKFRLSTEAVFCVSLFFVFTCWAFASPNGSVPDDGFHMASIFCSAKNGEPCEVPKFVSEEPCFGWGPGGGNGGPHPDVTPACVDPESLSTTVMTYRYNQGSYQGGYYASMNRFAGGSLQSAVIRIRFINASIFVALLGLFLWTARKATTNVTRPFVGAMLALLVPIALYFIPSINPTSWAFAGSSLIWVPLIVLSDRGLPVLKRSIAGVSAVLLLMLSIASKPEAVMYSLLAVVASFFLVAKLQRVRFQIAILITSLVGATTWYISRKSGGFSVIRYGFGEPEARNYFDPYYTIHNLPKVIQLYVGQFASILGDTDFTAPTTSWLLSAVALSIMIAIGAKNLSIRKVALVTCYAISMVSVPLIILNLSQRQVGAFITARYVWALLFGFVFLMLWNPKSNQNPLPRVPVGLACAAAHFAAVGALFAVLRRYTVGEAAHHGISTPTNYGGGIRPCRR